MNACTGMGKAINVKICEIPLLQFLKIKIDQNAFRTVVLSSSCILKSADSFEKLLTLRSRKGKSIATQMSGYLQAEYRNRE